MIDLRARPLVLRLRHEVRIARGSMRVTELVQVELRYDGISGFGEGAPTGYFGETLREAVRFLRADATRRAIGDDPWAMDEIERRLDAFPENYAAKAAIDCALYDLQGKLVDLPVRRLLGLRTATRPTAQTISIGSPEKMAGDARLVGSPSSPLKLKLGGRDGRDVERVEAVEAATDGPIQVDVNGAWSFDEAIAALPSLAALGVELCEQPLDVGDARAAELKRESPIPIYLDEECRRSRDVVACAPRAHGVVVKLAKAGGLREAVRVIETARALGLGVMLGCMAESSLGISAASQLAAKADYLDLDGNSHLAWDPWLPTGTPGLGVAPAHAGAGQRLRTMADTAYRARVRPHARDAYLLARQRRLKDT